MSSQDEIDTGSAPAEQPDDQAQTPDYDPLAALTVAEIRVASRELGADLVTAVTGQTEHYTGALARVLWMHRRRADRTRNPAELWAEIDAMPFLDLQEALGELAPPGQGVGPTPPQP